MKFKKGLSMLMITIIVIGVCINGITERTYAADNDWITVDLTTLINANFGSSSYISDIGVLANGTAVAIIRDTYSVRGTLYSTDGGSTWKVGSTTTYDSYYLGSTKQAIFYQGDLYVYEMPQTTPKYGKVYKSSNGYTFTLVSNIRIVDGMVENSNRTLVNNSGVFLYKYGSNGEGSYDTYLYKNVSSSTLTTIWYVSHTESDIYYDIRGTFGNLLVAQVNRSKRKSELVMDIRSFATVYYDTTSIANFQAKRYGTQSEGNFNTTILNSTDGSVMYLEVKDDTDGVMADNIYKVTDTGSTYLCTGTQAATGDIRFIGYINGDRYAIGYSSNTYSLYRNGTLVNANVQLTQIAGNAFWMYGIPSSTSYQKKIAYKKVNTSPSLSITAPLQNGSSIIGNLSYTPTIMVADPENDTLTCKYYINSEITPRDTKTTTSTSSPKEVKFNPFDTSQLSEGVNTIRFEVNDGRNLQNSVTSATINFVIDKTPPLQSTLTVSSTVNSITASSSATDTPAGPDPLPYRYTVGSTVSAWTTSSSYTQSSLIPNTAYTVKFEAKDAVGNISQQTKSICTKAQTPVLAVSNPQLSSLDVSATASDLNPSNTQYQIACGTKYVSQSGALATSADWITLTNKKITVTGLSPNTSYNFTAKARNAENTETAVSTAVSGLTLPQAPTGLTGTSTSNTVTLNWSAVAGATGYDVMLDETTTVNTGTSTAYTHGSLQPKSTHTYKVRARNSAGTGPWSNSISQTTKSSIPGVPQNLRATTITNAAITLKWDTVTGADSYQLKIDNAAPINVGTATTYTHNGLAADSQHTYQVCAVNDGGSSTYSTPVLTVRTQPNIPAVPSNIKVTPKVTELVITWDKVTGAESYDIAVGANNEIVGTVAGTVNTFTYTGLIPNTQYAITVRAENTAGESDWSVPVSAKTLQAAPDTAPVLSGNATKDTITLTWNAVNGADSYDLEITKTADNGITAVNDIAVTNYSHTNLIPNTEYSYRIRAKNSGGEGIWSQPLVISTKPDVPSIPQNISASSTSREISIAWDSVDTATGYEVEIMSGINDNQTVTDQVYGTTETSYIQTGLTPNTEYQYRVRAKNEAGVGDWSDQNSIMTKESVPGIPTNIQTAVTSNEITLSWNETPYAESYDIEIMSGVDEEQTVTGEVYGIEGNMVHLTDTTYTFHGLKSNTEYQYRIRANNHVGEGDWSEPIAVTTGTNAPQTPGNLKAEADSTKVTLTWDAVANATSYEVNADGTIIDTGEETICVHTNLEPNTEHKYKVRAVNGDGKSQWSEEQTITTYLLETPKNVQVNPESRKITLHWDEVAGATRYEVKINAEQTVTVTESTYIHEGLTPNTMYSYRIRAIAADGTSNWSEEIKASTTELANEVPKKIAAVAGSTKITVMWENALDADSYEISIDGGAAIDVGTATTYVNTTLTPGTEHKYKIRSKNIKGTSEWSNEVAVKTLAKAPEVPQNLKAEIAGTTVKVSWDAVAGAARYEVEADGVVKDCGTNISYVIENVVVATGHTYRVRAINSMGKSNWSEAVTVKATNPSYTIDCVQGEQYNLILTAEDVEDFNGNIFVVAYNKDELEVVDLNAMTEAIELTAGKIEGTNIEIVKAEAGRIVFRIDQEVENTETWSGILDIIKFKAKVNGQSVINYMVQ